MHVQVNDMMAFCPVTSRTNACLIPLQNRSHRSPVPFRAAIRSKHSRDHYVSHRRCHAVRAGLLDFLSPAAGKASGQAEELVDELLELARGTNGGARASNDTREQLEELVGAFSHLLA